MTAAIHGKATGLLLGAFDLTRLFNDISVSSTTEMVDASMFDATPGVEHAKEYVAGQSDNKVTAKGKFEGDKAAIQAQFEDAQGVDTDSPLCVVFGGWRPGNRVRLGGHLSGSLEVSSPLGGLVVTSGGLQTNGALRSGQLLTGGAIAVDGATNGSTVDGGAASPAGARVQLHVPANTRSGITTVVVQHSTNGTVWTDLYTFPVVAAGATAAVAATVAGTINRYTRTLITTAAGTGSAAVYAAIARS